MYPKAKTSILTGNYYKNRSKKIQVNEAKKHRKNLDETPTKGWTDYFRSTILK